MQNCPGLASKPSKSHSSKWKTVSKKIEVNAHIANRPVKGAFNFIWVIHVMGTQTS